MHALTSLQNLARSSAALFSRLYFFALFPLQAGGSSSGSDGSSSGGSGAGSSSSTDDKEKQ